MRPLTIFLSRLIGLLLLATALAMALHRLSFAEMAAAIVHDPPLLFILGLIMLTAGLAMVLAHNIWSGGVLPVVITVLGWITLIRGLIVLLAPPDALAFLFERMNFEKVFYPALIITAVIGAYLTYAGFRPSRR
jgi:hypothetical protein